MNSRFDAIGLCLFYEIVVIREMYKSCLFMFK